LKMIKVYGAVVRHSVRLGQQDFRWISRIVVVIGAMVTSPRNSSAESLVKMSTGRFLSGLATI
jgi:hypothetical protein